MEPLNDSGTDRDRQAGKLIQYSVEEVAWLPDRNPTWASQQLEEIGLRGITQHDK
ncbi:unnamed protein product [Sphenostylis stenocarpa]|uniref:Uncharacterized protein n=1 Tax=Sphenostylis stenocarpa TaxID=92480 RepID=A0AA86TK66_9FABA|nr:unnamed protein product [Sphenostylis stenocarpa]